MMISKTIANPSLAWKSLPSLLMSNKAFARAMSQIAVEAEKEREQEMKAVRRRHLLSKLGMVIKIGAVVAIAAVGYTYRAQVQSFVTKKLEPTAPEIGTGTGQALKGIQQDAAKRDKALDDIMAQPKTAQAKK